MKKVYWLVNIQDKSSPYDEVIQKEIWTIGDHKTIARDKILNLLNIGNEKTSYYSQDIISITKLREEDIEIGNPLGD